MDCQMLKILVNFLNFKQILFNIKEGKHFIPDKSLKVDAVDVENADVMCVCFSQ